MEFRILGPLEVCDGAGPVTVPGAKERALLADLLVHAGDVVPADRLVEDLWGDDPPARPANTLQGRVSALRRALGPAGAALLVTSPPGYRLDIGPDALDAARFERLVARAAAGAPDADRLLADGLASWRGPALAEFADRPWARAEAARLEELRLTARERLADLRLDQGRHAELTGELEALAAAHPLRERPRAQLMLALYRCGRQAEALRVYDATRTTLAEELGIDPSPELQRLHRAVLTQDPGIAAPGRAPRRTAPPPELPARLTPLVGREQELDEVVALVREHRLVTLTGPGGVGKTSVAVEAARRLSDEVPDGVRLLELAPLAEAALLPEAVASALGLREEPGPPGEVSAPAERLAEFLRDKDLLLVLDNCEHLAEACAALAARLVRAGPRVRVLATSREPLGVPGELVRPVAPLLDADAVRLFGACALRADPRFVLDPAGAPAVAETCRRLDGLPLAIELAAALVRALPPAQLAARLAAGLGLPDVPARGQDPRQRTLRATVEWSHALLDDDDRRLFRRLSVFAGGFTAEAAAAVCADDGEDVLPGLVRLVHRSLVVALGGEPARYRMLETLRAAAGERLAEAGETEAIGTRHTAWFAARAAAAAMHRTGRRAVRAVDADHDDLRAALERATAAGDRGTAQRMTGALGWYWLEHHTEEGRRLIAAALAAAGDQPPSADLGRLVLAASLVDLERFPALPSVAATARRALDLLERCGDRTGAAIARLLLAQVQVQQAGPGDEARRLVGEALAVFEAEGDAWGQAYGALTRLVVDPGLLAEPGTAEAVAQGSLERFDALDDGWGRTLALYALADLARSRGRVAEAIGRYETAIAAAAEDGPLWARCACLVELGGLVALRGDEERAFALHAEAVETCRRAGWRRGVAYAWNSLGALARARGDLERARGLHAEALPIVREAVGWSVAHTLAQLGCAEARLGALDDAHAHLDEATPLVLAAPEPPTAALVLVGRALVALGRADDEHAAVLVSAAAEVRERAGVTPVGAEEVEAGIAARAVRERLGPGALEDAGAAGRALTLPAALLLAADRCSAAPGRS